MRSFKPVTETISEVQGYWPSFSIFFDKYKAEQAIREGFHLFILTSTSVNSQR